MAGIGFQLQKMFQEDYFSSRAKAYAFTILLTSGPWLITIAILTSLQWGMRFYEVDPRTRELFVVSLSYTFIFSQVIYFSLQLVVTRYMADLFYAEKVEDVAATSVGLAKLTCGIALLLWLPFALFTPLPFWYDWIVFVLFITMNLIWVLFLYSTATKEYMNIVYAFLVGGFITVLAFWVLPIGDLVRSLTIIKGAAVMLGVFTLGMLITLLWLLYHLFISFPDRPLTNQWGFIKYIYKYPDLLLTGVFYSLGLWISNWIIWFGEGSILVEKSFRYHPDYDTALFWSFLTIIPTMMTFVISIETRFYKKYWTFYGFVNEGGSLSQIKDSKKVMIRVLKEEVIRLIRTQGLFTLLFLLLLPRFVTWFEWKAVFFELMPMTLIAVFSISLVLTLSLLHLYFDDRLGACITTFIFFTVTFLVTLFLLPLGFNWYGVGVAIGATLSFTYGGFRLISYVQKADFHIFTKKDPKHYQNSLEKFISHFSKN
ncbi:exopolysaccharide Pel transporter PelG [Fictibacillus sp. 7GRE50]|uniref:exopolysaccharide Pel transporter PelG n=1 Tax=Fictibacillus sp. 7GRE50 TaxID=2745878 RepID=UPI0018CF766F|nr:exopolysaccharide Pel transporter PelG [Fictibacillus sp. 7GRE50]MBH0164233.1 exopolysaccharide Pel transporter PelG [Fictibacillus sp. 7GRE50]